MYLVLCITYCLHLDGLVGLIARVDTCSLEEIGGLGVSHGLWRGGNHGEEDEMGAVTRS